MKLNLQFFGGRGAGSNVASSSAGGLTNRSTGSMPTDGSKTTTSNMMTGGQQVTTHSYGANATQSQLENLADTASFDSTSNHFGDQVDYIHATVNGKMSRPIQIETSITHNPDGSYDVLSTTTVGSFAGTIKTYKKYDTAVKNARNAFKKNVNAIGSRF